VVVRARLVHSTLLWVETRLVLCLRTLDPTLQRLEILEETLLTRDIQQLVGEALQTLEILCSLVILEKTLWTRGTFQNRPRVFSSRHLQ
jgi:hypothetical protein